MQWLINLNRMFSAAVALAGPIALAGLILTGLLLRFSAATVQGIPYASLGALHELLGVGLLAVIVYRALTIGLSSLAWRFRRARLSRVAEASWNGVDLGRGLLRAAFWVALGTVLISGLELFVAARHGFTLTGFRPGLGWGGIHAIGTLYLVGFLILWGFTRWRNALRSLRDYLYSP